MSEETQNSQTESSLTMPHIKSIIKMAQRPIHYTNFGVTLFLCLIVGILYYNNNKNQANNEQTKHQLELLNASMTLRDQQTILLKVVDSNLKSSTIDVKVQVAKTIYEMSQLKQVPINIICGLIEVESGWKLDAVSECGAQGLVQVMPIYARPYLREKGINYKKDIWQDPVINVMVGISMLRDFQDEHIEKGRTDGTVWTFALHTYFWGPSNSNQIFGKTDQRVNVPNMAYPQRIINASKKYKEMGL